MITDPRVEAYLDLLDPGNGPELEEIREAAEKSGVPVVRRAEEGLLRTLVAALRPAEILEVGTAVGYSAALMSRYLPEGGHITTIESFAPRVREAEKNFSRLHLTDRVTLLAGDAGSSFHLREIHLIEGEGCSFFLLHIFQDMCYSFLEIISFIFSHNPPLTLMCWSTSIIRGFPLIGGIISSAMCGMALSSGPLLALFIRR